MNENRNAEFWNDICGSHAALVNGFDISTRFGVEQFDNWYFEFYPYLRKYLSIENIQSMDVVEVGLGLGTVARFLGSRCRNYTGIDISPNTCSYVEQTFDNLGLRGKFLNQSILTDLVDQKFDFGVAIGSLHHTSDLEQSLNNFENMIMPGGRSLVMVYNEFEFRRIIGRPLLATLNFSRSMLNRSHVFHEQDFGWRGRNDSNSQGESAPFTSYQSKKFFHSKKRLCTYSVQKENFHAFSFLGRSFPRSKLLKHPFRFLGTDLYASGIRKP